MTVDLDRPTTPDPGTPAAPLDAGAAEAGVGGTEHAAAGAPPGAPVAATHPWAEEDRPRGLDAYFAPGGEDDAPPERVADERRMIRLLVVFVALLVGVPTLLTLAAFVGQLLAQRGGA